MAINGTETLYVRIELEGKPAKIIRDLKKRGIVKSAREAMVQGLLTYYDQLMTRDLREAQARSAARVAASSE